MKIKKTKFMTKFTTRLIFVFSAFICLSCSTNNSTDKRQTKRNNIVDVRERVKEIEIEDVLIGPQARLDIILGYLFISDAGSFDKMIHIFDKSNFKHIVSTAYRGQGPGEIARIGHIAENRNNKQFYVSDHGKYKIFSYYLDSLLANPQYMPEVRMEMDSRLFPDSYLRINDTLSIALLIEPIGQGDFTQFIARWNMSTNEVKHISIDHPQVSRRRVTFVASERHNLIVECYSRRDLMKIYDFEGNLKHTIYGSYWRQSASRQIHCFHSVAFGRDKIIAAFSGKENRVPTDFNPTQFLIFNLEGDYLKTLDVGCLIVRWCYDEEHNRIIMHLDDEMQFAYLELDGII